MTRLGRDSIGIPTCLYLVGYHSMDDVGRLLVAYLQA